MNAHDVEYMELYASDREQTTDHFVTSWGFRETAHAAADTGESVVLRQGNVQLVVTSGPVTRDFLAAHGDGIADIAFACADPAAAAESARAAGARVRPPGDPGGPVIHGFGDVRHTLVQRDAGRPPGLPRGRDWTPAVPAPEGADPRNPAPELRRLDHIAVCLEAGSLHDVARFYREAFGHQQVSTEYVEVGGQAMDSIATRSPSGGITFTFLEPDTTKQPGQINEFLARNGGPGVQHLAFLLDEIVPSVLEFEARGVEFLRTPDTYYDALAERIPSLGQEVADLRKTGVLADRDEWGHLLQLFARSPFEQRTLFFELIQRQGARGFGSANIRALYEAVRRSQQPSS